MIRRALAIVAAWLLAATPLYAQNIGGGGGAALTSPVATSYTWTGAQTFARGTQTTDSPPATFTETWNSSGTLFHGLLVNVTATAYTNNSCLADFQLAGVSAFCIAIFGGSPNINLASGELINWANGAGQTGKSDGSWEEQNSVNGTNADWCPLASGRTGWIIGQCDAAAPNAQTIRGQGVVAGTTNTAGAAVVYGGSPGTGTGIGGTVSLAAAPAGTTGSAQNALQNVITIDGKQHIAFKSAAVPTIGTCGSGSPAITAGSTDAAFEATIGTSATACTITFKIAYAAAPFCTLVDKTATANLTSYTISTTAIVLTMTSNSGNVIEGVCHGA